MAVDDRQARRLLRLAEGALLDVAGPGDELVVDRVRHVVLSSFCDNRAGVASFAGEEGFEPPSPGSEPGGLPFPYTPSVWLAGDDPATSWSRTRCSAVELQPAEGPPSGSNRASDATRVTRAQHGRRAY